MDELPTQLSDGSKLPDLQQSYLDDDTLDAYIADINGLVELIEVIPKYGAQQYAPEEDAKIDFTEAMSTLRSGGYRGLQVRYRYEGSQWWDTLMSTPEGIRIVRIQHDF